jgi:hypothetical protein
MSFIIFDVASQGPLFSTPVRRHVSMHSQLPLSPIVEGSEVETEYVYNMFS